MTRPGAIAALVGLLCGGSYIPARAALYGTIPSGGDTFLVTIDTVTGAATSQGVIGFPDVQGLAGRESDGTLFAATGQPGNADAGRILTIHPAVSSTGAALDQTYGLPIGGLARSPITAVLYATCTFFSLVTPDALCTVDQVDGSVTPVDPLHSLDPEFKIKGFDGLAFDTGGILYTSTRKLNPGEPRLYTVDTGTGVATAIGTIRDSGNLQLGAGVVGLEFVGATLFASTDDGRIITIDPATGFYTVVGSTTMGTVQGLANLTLPCSQSAPANPCIPGAGAGSTDCQMEWLTAPVPALDSDGVPQNRLQCTDDNSACDFGAPAGNQECSFHVQLCFNVSDPRFSCTSTDVARVQLIRPREDQPKDPIDAANRDELERVLIGVGGGVRGQCKNSGSKHGQLCAAGADCDASPGSGGAVCKGRFVAFEPALTASDRCTEFANIRVPAGQTRVLRSKAEPSNDPLTGHKRPSDRNALKLTCKPGVPIPTATLTATASATPTATNSIPPAGTPSSSPTSTRTSMPTSTDTSTRTTTPMKTPTFTFTHTRTPTNTPTYTTGPISFVLAPGGGTRFSGTVLGSCRGACVGGSNPGTACASNAQCTGGGTCQNRKCVGGPLNGSTCTTGNNCNGCSQTPPLGSCLIIQNPLFPVKIPLNGVCVPRVAPDIACVTDVECPAGKTCQLAKFDLVMGAADPTGAASITIPQTSVAFNPSPVSGLGTYCVAATGDGVGSIDCDGGSSNLNFASAVDHNTTPGDPNNSSSANGLPDDATCANTFTQPDGMVSHACLEGTNQCAGGTHSGMLCTVDGDCPGSTCTLCNSNSPHTGVCNSPTHVLQSGTFAPGDMVVELPLRITILQVPSQFGPDGLACTGDDTPPNPPVTTPVILSTGTSSVTVFDAGNSKICQGGSGAGNDCTSDSECLGGVCVGRKIAPGELCPPPSGFACVAQATGTPVSCATLSAGMLTGAKFGGGFPGLDTMLGDTATTFQFVAQ